LLARRSLFIERECQRSWYRLVAYPICRSVCLSVRKLYCGKTADFDWSHFSVTE